MYDTLSNETNCHYWSDEIMSCSCLKKQKKPGSDPFERPDISHAIEE